MIGSLGLPEIIMIAVVALVVIGPKKLPEVAKMVGKTMRDFRKTVNEAKSTIENEIDKVDMMKDLKEINEDFKSIRNFEKNVKSDLQKMIMPDDDDDKNVKNDSSPNSGNDIMDISDSGEYGQDEATAADDIYKNADNDIDNTSDEEPGNYYASTQDQTDAGNEPEDSKIETGKSDSEKTETGKDDKK